MSQWMVVAYKLPIGYLSCAAKGGRRERNASDHPDGDSEARTAWGRNGVPQASCHKSMVLFGAGERKRDGRQWNIPRAESHSARRLPASLECVCLQNCTWHDHGPHLMWHKNGNLLWHINCFRRTIRHHRFQARIRSSKIASACRFVPQASVIGWRP
jgi:hypothetical protein